MNIKQLKKLISQNGESQQLEFKTSTSSIKAAFNTICAFLNGKGGAIVFGAKNNGDLIGQNVTDNSKLEIANEVRKIEPNVELEIHYIPFENNKQIIVIEVPKGKHAPYIYDGRPFERITSSTSIMNQHRYEQLITQRAYLDHNWEKFTTDEYKIEDLDQTEILKTIEDGINQNRISSEAKNYSIEKILNNFQLIKDNQLTNAAVVLFCKNPEKIFWRSEIKMARFRGCDKTEGFIDNQWERGNVFQLLTIAHHFAARHLPIASYFEPGKLQRIDQPAVPQLALREALINAFCHRDYNIKSTTTFLAIFDDRLEIWNPGELPPELKLEQLKEIHNSFQRNELIANVFYKRGWIEKWGTGTTRMVEYCVKNKTPEPEFSEYNGGFSVVFPFKEPMNTVASAQPLPSLSERQIKILNILESAATLSANEILEKLKISLAPRTLRDDLAHLKQLGLIDSKGHAKNTVWFIVKPN